MSSSQGSTTYRRLTSLMLKSGAGPIASFLPLFAIPLVGAIFLTSNEFAIWALLASLATVSLSLDFGGIAYLMASIDSHARSAVLGRSIALSGLGSLMIGLIGAGAWIPYSQLEVGKTFGRGEGLAAIGVVTVGCVLRSVIQQLSQAALYDRDLVLRNGILLVHALVTFAAAAAIAYWTQSAWALPVAWVVGSSATLLVFAPRARRTFSICPADEAPWPPLRIYARDRSAASLLGGTMLQGDRWIVGAVGGPAALASYEIAWRVATLPRFMVQNLVVIAGVDAARQRRTDSRALAQTIDRIILISAGLCLLASAALVPCYWLIAKMVDLTTLPVVFAALLAGHAAIALTAAVSLAGTALGASAIDVPYLALSVILIGISAVVANASGSVEVFALLSQSGIVLASTLLLLRGRKMFIEWQKP